MGELSSWLPLREQGHKSSVDAFADVRTRRNREFFSVSPERIISALQLTGGKDVTPIEDIVEDDESQKALNEARDKRGRFNFSMVGIKKGTILEFIKDPSITCEVISNNKVKFEGKETSLSGSAVEIWYQLYNKKINNRGINGTLYWSFNRETLNEIRDRIESEN